MSEFGHGGIVPFYDKWAREELLGWLLDQAVAEWEISLLIMKKKAVVYESDSSISHIPSF